MTEAEMKILLSAINAGLEAGYGTKVKRAEIIDEGREEVALAFSDSSGPEVYTTTREGQIIEDFDSFEEAREAIEEGLSPARLLDL